MHSTELLLSSANPRQHALLDQIEDVTKVADGLELIYADFPAA